MSIYGKDLEIWHKGVRKRSAAAPKRFDSPLGTPRSKFVATCMNCSYTFRMGSSGLMDFCSKDCQTCYLIYISNPAHTPRQKANLSTKTNKQLVYEFQREIDEKEGYRGGASDEGEKMVDVNDLHDAPITSPMKFPSKSLKIGIPKSPMARVDRQPPTPMRPLH